MNKLTIHVEVPVIQAQSMVDGLAATAKENGCVLESVPGGGLRVAYPNAPAPVPSIDSRICPSCGKSHLYRTPECPTCIHLANKEFAEARAY